MTERERDQLLLRMDEQQRLILAALERGGLLLSFPPSPKAQEVTDAHKLARIWKEQGPKAFKEAQRRSGQRRARG